MIKVNFHKFDDIDDSLLKFAVIVSRYNKKWLFCKHKDRNTWEIPGGHREKGEAILETAKRELYEETGAKTFSIKPVCVYAVKKKTKIASYGMLFFSDITELAGLPNMEIECIDFFEQIPQELTYPMIQPKLMEHILSTLNK